MHRVGLFIFSAALIAATGYADPGGRTGRTLKNSTAGCGSCHGSRNTSVTATLNGPDTVVAGASANFSLVISGGSALGSGADIAAKLGTLAPVSSFLKLSGTELVQRSNTAMTGGSITYQFRYTAPATSGRDTLYATGLSTNSNGGTSGDQWNWAPNKGIVIAAPTSVQSITAATDFALIGNHPNPFNPSTTIQFRLSESGPTSLRLYSLLGQELAMLVNDVVPPGLHSITLDASGLPAGAYLYKLQSGTRVAVKKMLLVK